MLSLRVCRDAFAAGACAKRVKGQRHSRRAPLACRLPSHSCVSQKNVEIVIGRLATDEALRAEFIRDPLGTLRQLAETGIQLNTGEIDALLSTPADQLNAMADWVHPRLQKAHLKRDHDEP
jgi:hypothetical protein